MRTRKWIAIMAGLVGCAAICAALDSIVITVPVGALTSGTNTSVLANGYVEDVQLSVSDGVSTGVCTVAVQAADSSVASYNIATATVTNELIVRPRVDGTSTAGVALTNDPPGRYPLHGDTLTFTVTGSPTNLTWTCRIKTNDN